jgi:DNA-binding transcriptional LysR family regulator
MIGSLLLPRIYGEFARQQPDIRLEITEGGRKELLEGLLQDGVDMVFLPHVQPFEEGLKALELARFEVVCAVSKENPLSRQASLGMVDLARSPLVLFKNSFFQTEEIKKRFAQEQVEPWILLQTAQLSTVETMIESNAAVGFLFKPLIEKNGGIAPVSLEPPLHVSVSLVLKKDMYLSDSMRSFLRFAESFRDMHA